MKTNFILLLTALSFGAGIQPLFAQSGTIDNSFNGVGHTDAVNTSSNLTYSTKAVDFPSAGISNPGKFYQISTVLAPSGYYVIRVSAYLTDGTMNTSFNGGIGYKDYNIVDGSSHFAKAIEIRNDSRIVVGFEVYDLGYGTKDAGVMVIDENGLLQTSFNTTGYKIIDIQGAGGIDEVGAIATTANGSIIIAGGTTLNSSTLNAYDTYTLVLDISGAQTGLLVQDLYAGLDAYEFVTAIDVKRNATNSWQADENRAYIFGGFFDTFSGAEGAHIFKMNNLTAAIDPTFGNSVFTPGIVSVPYIQTLTDGCYDDDNGIIAVGLNASGNATIVKFTVTGLIDTGFDNDGMLALNFAQNVTSPRVQTRINSNIVVAGTIGNNIAIARILANGSYDTQFSQDGKTEIPSGFSFISMGNLLIQPNHDILTSLSYATSNYYDVLFKIKGTPAAGDCNGDGVINGSEIAGDIDCSGAIERPAEVCGDLNGDGIISGTEIAGDKNGDGVINYPTEVAGDLNGDGDTEDADEIAGDLNGNGTIDFPTEICGDLNGDGDTEDTDEVAGDQNGDGIINRPTEVAGDLNGNGTIDIPLEVAGDTDGDGVITNPSEVCGDLNGNGVIDRPDEVAGDINGNGTIERPSEIAGDLNGNGTIEFPTEICGDLNGNSTIDSPDEVGGDANGNGTIEDPEIEGDTNGNGILDPSELVGINELNTIFILVYPNPTTENLIVSSQNEIETLSIVDMTGRLIQTVQVHLALQYTLDITQLEKGSYMLIATNASSRARVAFVKQ